MELSRLRVGDSGDIVARLHEVLALQGVEVSPEERKRRFFGPSTREAVREFQQQHGLPVSGALDEQTASAMSAATASFNAQNPQPTISASSKAGASPGANIATPLSPGMVKPGAGILSGTQGNPGAPVNNQSADATIYTVIGAVTSPDRAGVGSLLVQVVDKNVGPDVLLAETTTDDSGRYKARFTAESLLSRKKTQPDLQARVYAGQTFLAASDVHYNVTTNETLNVNLPANLTALPSEYETLTGALAAHYAGSLGALQETSDRQDITYLANKTGWDARAVALAALADQFSQITAPVASADKRQVRPKAFAIVSLRPEFYYALFRAGLSANADSLFQAGSRKVQAIWQQAITQGIIPQALADDVPSAVQSFQTLSAAHSLNARPPVGLSRLKEMLQTTLPNTAEQEQFAQIYAQYHDDWNSFWPALEQVLGAAPTKRLQLMGQLFYLTVNNAPLVNALINAEGQSMLSSTLDLATRGYYDSAKWMPLIGESIPPGIPGANTDEQRSNYAQLLAAQVRVAFPTAVLADQVKCGILPIADNVDVAADVVNFLTSNQGQFEIGIEPVEAYIARTKLAETPPAVVTQIKRLQRVYQLTPDDVSLAVLLHHNLDSAFAITRYDSAGFVRAFQDKLGGSKKASAIHARAKQIFAAVLSVTVAYLNARVAPTLGGGTPVLNGFPPQSSTPTYPVIAYPTLEDLFGSLDYCNCPDCGSIMSPAAYLVDLLNYIDQPAPTAGFQNPQAVLFQRRPDLQYLPLTCENTNTALPYIDIVNETLEYYVANGSLTGYQGHDTGDAVTSAELLASPQFVNDAAYTTLQNAFFPPPLPYNRPLALLRLQLQNLGVSLPDAMVALRANDQLVNSTSPTSFGWSDILIERLTISRDENRLFTDSSLQLGDLYGLPNASALATLQQMSLQDFSRRLGVSYDDLSSIIQTQFINPNAILIPHLQRLNASFTTLQTLHDNLSTDPSLAATFISALPAGLDATQYGGSNPTDYQAVVNWVTDPKIHSRIMDIITISNPTDSANACSGTTLQFRYSNPDNTKNLLSGTDFVKLIRFIRLWQKLAPLLGDTNNAVLIEQTDDILAALYPSADIPTGTSDVANDLMNRPLLDAGFQTLLLRLGFFFQVMHKLSLTADAALAQLLACWSPIGTVGANALYRRIFLTPTLLQQDPGAQTATIANAVNVGDVLNTCINGEGASCSNGVNITHTVVAGETPTTIAAAIANAINATTAIDPASGLPLNQRFFASAHGGVITIKAGFTLTCSLSAGASETYKAATQSPLSQSATVAAPVTPGDTLTTTINGVAIPYAVAVGDTPSTIAADIAAAINTTTIQDPFSGLPLNNLIVALPPAAAVITISAANAGAPFTLTCSLTSANAGTYTAGPPIPASQTATITGTVNVGDVLTTKINGVAISYSAGAADVDATALARSITTTINTSVLQDPTTDLPLSRIVQASSVANVITITALDPATPFTLACSVTSGTETYTSAGPFSASQRATVSGTIPPNAILTTTVNTLPLFYTVVAADTPATIAANIATAINTTTTSDAITNLPLNSVVTASASGGVLTITAVSPTTPFTLAVSLSSGAYTAGRQVAPFADEGYGDFLADPSQTLFGHEPMLCAACNLTGAEFALITTALAFDPSTPLTLANVSALFRYGWLAHTLRLSVLEFLLLREFTGLDSFASLDPGATQPTEPSIIRFIRLLQAFTSAGLEPVQALYLIWNQDISGKSTPPLADITGLAFALRADFAAVEAQFILKDDPDGSIAQGLMTLVYGSTASDFFFGLLNNTFTTSVMYSNPTGRPTLPQPVIDASSGQLSYDDLRKQLSFSGVLDTAKQTVIDNAIIVNTTDSTDKVAAGNSISFTPASMNNIYPGAVLVIDSSAAQETVSATSTTATTFVANTIKVHDGTVTAFAIVNDPSLVNAIASLAAASQQAVTPFFAAYPELVSLYTAYAASSDPVQTKRTNLLNSFLPILKQKRKQEQALASITSAAATDPSFANALLQDPTILHADADPTSAAVIDLTAIEAQGLSAQFFLTNNPTATPDQAFDSVPLLSYIQTTTIGGTITINDVLTTTINGISIPYKVVAADTTLAVLAGHIAAAINATAPLNWVISASTNGNTIAIVGFDPSGANTSFSLACSASASATETYMSGGGGPIAGIWSGYINAPQDGFYDIAIATDPGAGIVLEIGSATVVGTQVGSVWRNQSPISLVAGLLVPIVLTVTSIKTTLSVRWKSLGLGWEVIPGEYLYSLSLVNRLSDTYVRFLKATSLATALSLTANEIAYLDTATNFSVNTTCGTKITPGSAIFTPLSMNNIVVGSVLIIDSGSAQETVTVTATTPATFSAVAVNPHDGTASSFAIVDRSFPTIGQGWLNTLAVGQKSPDSATAASLCGVLTALLDFARIKRALSPGDERLLAILQNPAATLPNTPNQTALLSLTGWAQTSVNALLTQFYGNTQPTNLSSVEHFRRVYDAYAIVHTCRVTASALISAVTNAPSATTVSVLQSALRALYAESDWLTVIRPINDTMRIQQRDALVAYILQQLGDSYAQSLVPKTTSADAPTGATQLNCSDTTGIAFGMLVQNTNIAPGTVVTATTPATVTVSTGILAALPKGSNLVFVPENAVEIDTPDRLFEYFLIDAETQPPVETSRIRLALSSVQLFIERIVRNLEPQVSPTDIDTSRWQWMKRYRVWQANREVFLWPENWLYPELRDDQSPFFQQMMSSLLQSDITDDAAANAYLDYLTSLEEVAKLEPCGLYYQPGTADMDEASYVVARTAGAHRKYYFRELQYGSWTPWTQVKIDCEDMPITPIVWNGRLFLFWLKILKQASPQPIPSGTSLNSGSNVTSSDNINNLSLDNIQRFGQAGVKAQGHNNVSVQAVLCWSEFYNGKWQPTKTSDLNRPTSFGTFDTTGPNSFDVNRNLIRILPVQASGALADALIMKFFHPLMYLGGAGGFILYNTHSLPVAFEDLNPYSQPIWPAQIRSLGPISSYTGGSISDTFAGTYSSYSGGLYLDTYTNEILGINRIPRYVESPSSSMSWDAPFIFEDRRYLFYVTTVEYYYPFDLFKAFGILSVSPSEQLTPEIPPLVLHQPLIQPVGPEGILVTNVVGNDPIAVQHYLSQGTNIRAALGSSVAISYQGQEISPIGSVIGLNSAAGSSERSA
jgi:peptidoglycan hydrolase-like protein with peptidoglycan-binding domain